MSKKRAHAPIRGELKSFVQSHANLDPADSLRQEAERLYVRAKGAGISTTAGSIAQLLSVLRTARKNGGVVAPRQRVRVRVKKTNGHHVAPPIPGAPISLTTLREQLVALEATITAKVQEAITIIDAVSAEETARKQRVDALRQQLAEMVV